MYHTSCVSAVGKLSLEAELPLIAYDEPYQLRKMALLSSAILLQLPSPISYLRFYCLHRMGLLGPGRQLWRASFLVAAVFRMGQYFEPSFVSSTSLFELSLYLSAGVLPGPLDDYS